MAEPKKKRRLHALAEFPLAIASSAVAEPLAGIAGLYGLATGGVDEGVRRIESVRDKVTYQPQTEGAKESLSRLGMLLAPIEKGLNYARDTLGGAAFDATGSPGAATAAAIVPDALLSLIGGRQALNMAPDIERGLVRMAQRTADAPTTGSPGAQLGIFAGKGAKTADLNAMAVAQQQLDAGADPRVVWTDTGWMRGPDGQMRFEIDDSRAALTGFDKSDEFARVYAESGRQAAGERVRELAGYVRPYRREGIQQVTDVLEHNPLTEAYPDQWKTGYRTDPDMSIGHASFDPKRNFVALGPAEPNTARSSLLHELQHGIQQREGFARGGNPESAFGLDVLPQLDAVRAQRKALDIDPYQVQNLKAAGFYVAPELEQKFQLWQQLNAAEDALMSGKKSPFDAYRHLAGEAEARAVQKRMDYSPAQRRSVYPLDDYDVPIDELIMRFGGNGPQASINAWHGSPHDFDRFSMDAIGTGEGAQAYGHGLYFAGNKEVAGQYQRTLAADGFRRANGSVFDPSKMEHLNVRNAARKGDLEAAIAKAESLIPGATEQTLPMLERDLAALRQLQAEGGISPNDGRLYDVELAPDETDLLDWDAPLSEQPEKVRAALAESDLNVSGDDTGNRVYRTAAARGFGDAAERHKSASEYMRQLGIPGIRYLDGGSRAAGDGSRNYVMFDDSLVKIRAKDGVPLPDPAPSRLGGLESAAASPALAPKASDVQRMKKMGEAAYIREITGGRPAQTHAESFEFREMPLPEGAQKVSDHGGFAIHEEPGSEGLPSTFYATDKDGRVVGYIAGDMHETELLVDPAGRGRGVGAALQRAYRTADPFAPSGGMTAGGERLARKLYREFVSGAKPK